MRSSHTVDRIDTAFDDERLVAGAGLLLPATLALHLGLKGLADRFLDLGRAADAANVGDKLLTLVMSALGGGDSIDDADALRAGGTSRILGFSVKAPSTLGTFLRRFRWGHVRQLDVVTRLISTQGVRGKGFLGREAGAETLKIAPPRSLPPMLLQLCGSVVLLRFPRSSTMTVTTTRKGKRVAPATM